MSRIEYIQILSAAKDAAREFSQATGLSTIEKMNRQLDVTVLIEMIEHQVDESVLEGK